MRKILFFLVSLILFTSNSITTYAKPRLDVVRQGGFSLLSDEDMADTIQALTDRIAKDCGVKAKQTISCYDWPESSTLAYNTLYGINIICVNLSGFRTSEDAEAANETVEYHLVKTIAHEVRHSYQWERMKDGSDYGNSCLQGFADYQAYSGDRASYYAQFIEADAEAYAISYADRYFKK
jgi:hypothetical protein